MLMLIMYYLSWCAELCTQIPEWVNNVNILFNALCPILACRGPNPHPSVYQRLTGKHLTQAANKQNILKHGDYCYATKINPKECTILKSVVHSLI